MLLDTRELTGRIIGQLQTDGVLPTPLPMPDWLRPGCCPPPPNKTPITLDSLKNERDEARDRVTKLERMVEYLEKNPGALDVLQEIARR